MRICHILSGDLWAGAEAQVATASSYLVERPEVTLMAILLNDGWLARELRQLGVPVTVLDEQRLNPFRLVAALGRFLKENRVDLLHTHRYKENILGSIAAKLAGVPHVVRTVHLGKFDAIPRANGGPMGRWTGVKSHVFEALDKFTLRCVADRVVTISRRMASALEDCGYDASVVTHIHNGVDLRNVRAARTADVVRRELGIGADEVIIGTAGRLAPVKGHVYLLRAARRILAQEPRVRFLFVGSGPLKEALVATAADLQVDRHCLFIDRVMDLRVGIYDVIAAMDIFVLPSLDEGVPMALLEALALERPAIATAVGGVPEIITHRATGLLVEPTDDRQLAEACLELVRNRDWARVLGIRGRRVVERDFSRERNGEALLKTYGDVMRRW